ncbi:hypothetical protein P7K49_014687 [Saguinus oedipus]|uniref:Lysozyme n=1 Tax=Saguinus oedipus TaxID=9490 RepID=A0ABQ9V917_SAGOE|nr:hypothetical protein P7K49_014687 [Saguinus oedipus]
MAYYESGYNTTAQTVLDDGSIDYGIFQINSFAWCRQGKLQERNHCHVACSGGDKRLSSVTTSWSCLARPSQESLQGIAIQANCPAPNTNVLFLYTPGMTSSPRIIECDLLPPHYALYDLCPSNL